MNSGTEKHAGPSAGVSGQSPQSDPSKSGCSLSRESACSVCGKIPDTDMGGCGFCDNLICDDCGTVAHDNTFCSQACADEYAWTWLDDTPNDQAQPPKVG